MVSRLEPLRLFLTQNTRHLIDSSGEPLEKLKPRISLIVVCRAGLEPADTPVKRYS